MITIPINQKQPEKQIEPIAVKPAEACKMLGISLGTLMLWTRKGLIPHRRIGGRILYSIEALKEFVACKNSE